MLYICKGCDWYLARSGHCEKRGRCVKMVVVICRASYHARCKFITNIAEIRSIERWLCNFRVFNRYRWWWGMAHFPWWNQGRTGAYIASGITDPHWGLRTLTSSAFDALYETSNFPDKADIGHGAFDTAPSAAPEPAVHSFLARQPVNPSLCEKYCTVHWFLLVVLILSCCFHENCLIRQNPTSCILLILYLDTL